jgi:YesN/AraC family two-component response regulator
MHHVTYLRMRRAAELLSATGDKVETIAAKVGYQNPFVFSTTFKKWIGWRPSEQRTKTPKPA